MTSCADGAPLPPSDDEALAWCIHLIGCMSAASNAELYSLLVHEVEPLRPSRNVLRLSGIDSRVATLSTATDFFVSSTATRIMSAWKAHALAEPAEPLRPTLADAAAAPELPAGRLHTSTAPRCLEAAEAMASTSAAAGSTCSTGRGTAPNIFTRRSNDPNFAAAPSTPAEAMHRLVPSAMSDLVYLTNVIASDSAETGTTMASSILTPLRGHVYKHVHRHVRRHVHRTNGDPSPRCHSSHAPSAR